MIGAGEGEGAAGMEMKTKKKHKLTVTTVKNGHYSEQQQQKIYSLMNDQRQSYRTLNLFVTETKKIFTTVFQ